MNFLATDIPCKYYAAGYCPNAAENKVCKERVGMNGNWVKKRHHKDDGQLLEQEWLRGNLDRDYGSPAGKSHFAEESKMVARSENWPIPGYLGRTGVQKYAVSNPSTPADFPELKYALVIDVEGREGIIELPVIVLALQDDLKEAMRFHRWVRSRGVQESMDYAAQEQKMNASWNSDSTTPSSNHSSRNAKSSTSASKKDPADDATSCYSTSGGHSMCPAWWPLCQMSIAMSTSTPSPKQDQRKNRTSVHQHENRGDIRINDQSNAVFLPQALTDLWVKLNQELPDFTPENSLLVHCGDFDANALRSEMREINANRPEKHPFVALLSRWCNLKDLAFDYVLHNGTFARETTAAEKIALAEELSGMVKMQKYFKAPTVALHGFRYTPQITPKKSWNEMLERTGEGSMQYCCHHQGTADTENIALLLRFLLATKPDLVFRPTAIEDVAKIRENNSQYAGAGGSMGGWHTGYYSGMNSTSGSYNRYQTNAFVPVRYLLQNRVKQFCAPTGVHYGAPHPSSVSSRKLSENNANNSGTATCSSSGNAGGATSSWRQKNRADYEVVIDSFDSSFSEDGVCAADVLDMTVLEKLARLNKYGREGAEDMYDVLDKLHSLWQKYGSQVSEGEKTNWFGRMTAKLIRDIGSERKKGGENNLYCNQYGSSLQHHGQHPGFFTASSEKGGKGKKGNGKMGAPNGW
ncbi:unnamed protein product [Amoebophrya sp. A120]|nr:unnamed protein product [Amoebophrya sp. A120]|eukprot:GSA120T00012062001.1